MWEKLTFDGPISQGMVSERAVKTPPHSDEMYRQLAESSSDFIYMIDQEFRVTYVNKAGAGALRMSPEEAMGKYLTELFPRDTAEKMTGALARVFISGKQQSNEMIHRFFNRDFHMHVSLNPILDDEGNIDSVMGISRDITERKRMEEALRVSEEKYRSLVEEVGDMAWDVDEHSICTYVSPRSRDILGYEPEEMIGRSVHEFMAPGEADRLESMKDGGPKNLDSFSLIEFTMLRKDGSPIIVETSGIPLFGDQARFKGNRGVIRDITERKRTEAMVRASEANLAHAERMARLGHWSLNPLTGEITGSKELFEIYSFNTEGGWSYEKFVERVHPDDLGAIEAADREAMKTGKPVNLEYRIVLPDGSLRYIHSEGEAKYDKAGNPVEIFGIAQDITERKKIEEALAGAKARAEFYVDLMGHDINNINQVALGYLELARDLPADGGQQAEFLDKSVEVLQRSTLLIQNVRKLQKIHEGAFQPKDVDVSRILADIQREYRAVPGKMITLKMKCQDSCIVCANELLHDVYANLVNNAIKHTVGGTEIAIDMDVIEDNGKHYCQVAVEDNGPGIPDCNKERIFNRRHMGSSRGIGLGLYIVKSLVESYGGRVWVEDRIKGDHAKGTRFVVELPTI